VTPAPSTEISAGPEKWSTSSLLQLADSIERTPNRILRLWIFAYFAVLWRVAQRPLWFDELFTFHIAKSPTWKHFLGSIQSVDLNPPLSYMLVRLSTSLFGDSPFAVRLPSMLGFFAAGIIIYSLVKRRLGGGMALAAIGILWSSSLTEFAVDARPYGLLLGFFTLAALCWMNAIEPESSTRWHVGLSLAICAMFLTHCFSPVFAAAIGAGELVRAIVLRRIDRRVWSALLMPLCILPLYIPLVRTANHVLFPQAFASTIFTIPIVYAVILAPLLPAIAAILLIWVTRRARGRRIKLGELARPHEIAFAVASFLAPLPVMGYCIRSGGPFWPRYAIGAIVGATLILVALLAFATKRNPNLTVSAAGFILMAFCVTKAGTGHLMAAYENVSTAYKSVRPELPFVTASGLTFLEMDHREASGFLNRVYYLTDHDSSLRYHTNLFESMPIVKQRFAVRANVEPYRDFTSGNRQFLVLATRGFPEDWLLLKLADDGADIRLLRDESTGYRDHELYLITLRP
jgi:4-amino-4-deoxy-L-arabinose transferase-like glycosyltransferase